jgi:hypothetical protein
MMLGDIFDMSYGNGGYVPITTSFELNDGIRGSQSAQRATASRANRRPALDR